MSYISTQEILDLFPIIAYRNWQLKDGVLRDAEGYCPLCALSNEIGENSDIAIHFWLTWDSALQSVLDIATAADIESPHEDRVKWTRKVMLQILQPKKV